jgi:hypothetical protein
VEQRRKQFAKAAGLPFIKEDKPKRKKKTDAKEGDDKGEDSFSN